MVPDETKLPRIMRAVDFVAETLERYAALVSPEEAAKLLETAARFRQSEYPRMVRPMERESE
jgi:hypothetical protein